MNSLEQKKRGLCPYDDKRYLLADLPDGSPNPNTHAYGHKDLADEEEFEADMPDVPGSDLIIEHRERRFLQKHARVAKKLRALPGDQETDSAAEEKEEIPGDVALSTGDWDKPQRWQPRVRVFQDASKTCFNDCSPPVDRCRRRHRRRQSSSLSLPGQVERAVLIRRRSAP